MNDANRLQGLLSAWLPSLPLANRLAALAALMVFWHGKRRKALRPVQSAVALPPGLEWLYAEIAARNPGALAGPHPGWVEGGPLVTYNNLRDPRQLEVEGGKLAFLSECQGVFRCAVSADTDDGAVFLQDMHSTRWKRCAQALSDFLLWMLVYELKVNSQFMVWGLFSPADAAKITEPLVRVKTDKISVYGPEHEIWHGPDQMLIASPNSPREICLEVVARDQRCFARLKRAAAWAE